MQESIIEVRNMSFFAYVKTYYKDYFTALAASIALVIILLIINIFLPKKDPYDYPSMYIIFAVFVGVATPPINKTRNYATPVGRVILHVLLTVVIFIPILVADVVISRSYGVFSVTITQIIYLYVAIVTSLYFFLITNQFTKFFMTFILLTTISIFMRTDMYRGAGVYAIAGIIFSLGIIAVIIFYRVYMESCKNLI